MESLKEGVLLVRRFERASNEGAWLDERRDDGRQRTSPSLPSPMLAAAPRLERGCARRLPSIPPCTRAGRERAEGETSKLTYPLNRE